MKEEKKTNAAKKKLNCIFNWEIVPFSCRPFPTEDSVDDEDIYNHLEDLMEYETIYCLFITHQFRICCVLLWKLQFLSWRYKSIIVQISWINFKDNTTFDIP